MKKEESKKPAAKKPSATKPVSKPVAKPKKPALKRCLIVRQRPNRTVGEAVEAGRKRPSDAQPSAVVKQTVRVPRKKPAAPQPTITPKGERKRRQALRAKFLSAVTDRINESFPAFGGSLEQLRPIFIVDCSNPDEVLVQIFASGLLSGFTPSVLSNKQLYGQRKFWGYLEHHAKGVRALVFKRETRIKESRSITSQNLVLAVKVDTLGLLPQRDLINVIFSDYEGK